MADNILIDEANDVFRDFVTDGVPASGPNDPSKSAIRALFADIIGTLIGASSGITQVATAAALTTPSDTDPKIAIVTSDPTSANNGYWLYSGGAWAIDTALNTAFKGPAGLLSAATNTDMDAGTSTTLAVTPAGLTHLGLNAAIATNLLAVETLLSTWGAISNTPTLNQYVNASGVPTAATGYAFTSFAVPATQLSIKVTATVVNTALPLACYYSDTAGTVFIGHSAEMGGGGSGNVYTDHALTLPPGTKFIKLNYAPTQPLSVQALTLSTNINDRIDAVADDLSDTNAALADVADYVNALKQFIYFAQGDGISFGQTDGTYGAILDENGFRPQGSGGGGGRDNSTYLLGAVTDGAGKKQIQLVNAATSAVVWTTSGGDDKSDPTFGTGNIVRYFDATAGELYLPVAGGTPKPVLPSPAIVAWGDSLTQGEGTANPPTDGWVAQLATLLGRTVVNMGVQTQTSIEIAARQGGTPATLTITGNQIPASGSVAVTAYSSDFLLNVGTLLPTPSLDGTLAGVHGTLTNSLTSGPNGTYTFTRTASGGVVACPANTPFIPDFAVEYAGDIQTFIYGRNNPSPTQNPADVAASIAYLTPLSKRFIVGSVLTQTGEIIGTAGYNGIWSINAALQAAWPDNYLDLTTPPNADELAFLLATYSYTPDSTDTTAIANGTFPPGLRRTSDVTHLNIMGYAIWVRRFATFITTKGW